MSSKDICHERIIFHVLYLRFLHCKVIEHLLSGSESMTVSVDGVVCLVTSNKNVFIFQIFAGFNYITNTIFLNVASTKTKMIYIKNWLIHVPNYCVCKRV